MRTFFFFFIFSSMSLHLCVLLFAFTCHILYTQYFFPRLHLHYFSAINDATHLPFRLSSLPVYSPVSVTVVSYYDPLLDRLSSLLSVVFFLPSSLSVLILHD
ncbi:hypothetical protein BXZ70DRAFT_674760 [Cristinia sonorae]|uniref:Uncharacterized protein n=1 Tax=Cristinia sonorae TaxID=1940300 RepID=A0A8K0XSN3_9AGAR|nr:hypothetical protein BXZ70DRAFT_674760 [Cristinia sonorae]